MVIGIDLGGSFIRGAEINGKDIFLKKIIPTPKKKEDILRSIFGVIDSYEDKSKIGLGVAAFMKDEQLYDTPNMDFSGVDLKKLISKRYPKSLIKIENDAHCAGLAEQRYGFGRGIKNFIMLTLGTGIGGAVFIDGKLYKGNGFASEPGHIIIDGGKDLEFLASGTASNKLAIKNGFKDNFEMFKKAKRGNVIAIRIYSKIGETLGMGLLSLANVLDPERIILGGGFSKVSYVISRARKTFHSLDPMKRNIKVIRAKLGSQAGLVGAALLFNKV